VTDALPPVIAAGALCWRRVRGRLVVLLVHRADRADVSLPKGKVDPGETLPQTAVREVEEETGLTIALNAPLGTIEYVLPGGRDKVVHYWSSEISDEVLQNSRFRPNSEIASVEWLPIARARRKLSYEHDKDLIDRFTERVKAGHERTFAIVVLRHAKAVPPTNWDGPDATRPLLQRGTDQANNVATGIAAFAPIKLISSSALRCASTIAPLARILAIPVRLTANLSQDAYEQDTANVRKIVEKRLTKMGTTVLCSHGPVIPEIIAEIAHLTRSRITPELRRSATLATGEYSVFHISIEHPIAGIIAMETHGPAIDPAAS
jgi:8-oxo-dGTP pyrophosphatase MutT (NUDIX family)